MDRPRLSSRARLMLRLPDFLIIGAMKAGTTSLYHDLLTQPAVYFPHGEKEPQALADDRVLTERGRRRYARLYRGAERHQRCGDASTGYTKLPDVPGVSSRARRVLGPEMHAIYLVREPLARTISQHHHHLAGGWVPASLDDAIHTYPRLVDYSRYAFQLKPWLDVCGAERIRVVRFEDYVSDRAGTVASLGRFLGFEARPELVEATRVFGRTNERSVPGGFGWKLTRSPLYRRLVRRLLPERTRESLRRALLPKPPPRPSAPREATLRLLAERLAPEVEELSRLMGARQPLWDLEAAIRSHLEAGAGATPTAASPSAPAHAPTR